MPYTKDVPRTERIWSIAPLLTAYRLSVHIDIRLACVLSAKLPRLLPQPATLRRRTRVKGTSDTTNVNINEVTHEPSQLNYLRAFQYFIANPARQLPADPLRLRNPLVLSRSPVHTICVWPPSSGPALLYDILRELVSYRQPRSGSRHNFSTRISAFCPASRQQALFLSSCVFISISPAITAFSSAITAVSLGFRLCLVPKHLSGHPQL